LSAFLHEPYLQDEAEDPPEDEDLYYEPMEDEEPTEEEVCAI
jgi:hypothetical protein